MANRCWLSVNLTTNSIYRPFVAQRENSTTIAIDLSKNVFEVAVERQGRPSPPAPGSGTRAEREEVRGVGVGAVAAVDGATRREEDVTFLAEVEDQPGVEVNLRAPDLGGR